MSFTTPLEAPQLPATVKRVLDEFLLAVRNSLGGDLLSAVLYGSGAEGKLRSTSDVNLVLVLSSFEQPKVDSLRTPLRIAQAAIQLRPMFLLKEEISKAARAFASKFADILRRRVILYGEDPFAAVSISQDAQIVELRQQLLNQILRLRASYASRSLREEQLILIIAHAIGPLRSSAAAFFEIQGSPASSPQQALERIGSELGVPNWTQTLGLVSALQDSPRAAPREAAPLFFAILDLACRLQSRMETVSGEVQRESF
jgi:predicted nucleotidyltransferase